jgi:hypothetical protein
LRYSLAGTPHPHPTPGLQNPPPHAPSASRCLVGLWVGGFTDRGGLSCLSACVRTTTALSRRHPARVYEGGVEPGDVQGVRWVRARVFFGKARATSICLRDRLRFCTPPYLRHRADPSGLRTVTILGKGMAHITSSHYRLCSALPVSHNNLLDLVALLLVEGCPPAGFAGPEFRSCGLQDAALVVGLLVMQSIPRLVASLLPRSQ